MQNVNQWNSDQANKTWMNQFAENAKKQEQEWQAKPKGLSSTFAWGPEVAEQLKKKEEAKHDAWNPPLGSEQKNEVEKKQSFG